MIHSSAVEPKTRADNFSSREDGPNAAIWSRNAFLSAGPLAGMRKSTRVISSHTVSRNNSVYGTQKSIHWPKPMAGRSGKKSFHCSMNTRLGGVPTGVAMPPMVAPYPTERASAAPSLPCPGAALSKLRPIGSITSTAAVLLIHMLSSPLASNAPRTRRDGAVPMRSTMRSAMRRCNPLRSMPSASRKPPMKRKITSFP